MMVMSVSVIPTVAMASGPRRDTQKTSATANTDSMIISITIGTARRTRDSVRLPAVWSWTSPRMARPMMRRAPRIGGRLLGLMPHEDDDELVLLGDEQLVTDDAGKARGLFLHPLLQPPELGGIQRGGATEGDRLELDGIRRLVVAIPEREEDRKRTRLN